MGFIFLDILDAHAVSKSTLETIPKKPIRVLLVGGGASHDFDKWYKDFDVKTLEKDNFAKVTYTDDPKAILALLQETDVLFLTNNQPVEDPKTRAAIFDFAASGKGLVLAHAALWYNWADWPEYNRELVSGGSRGHDKYGNFQVEILKKKHPVTKGISPSFNLEDELYYFKVDDMGPGVEILAKARSGEDDSFPSVFVVRHPTTRIVGIALGHDGASHHLEAYHKLIRNAVKWVNR
jgi:type 1 glutamine amidotransferase